MRHHHLLKTVSFGLLAACAQGDEPALVTSETSSAVSWDADFRAEIAALPASSRARPPAVKPPNGTKISGANFQPGLIVLKTIEGAPVELVGDSEIVRGTRPIEAFEQKYLQRAGVTEAAIDAELASLSATLASRGLKLARMLDEAKDDERVEVRSAAKREMDVELADQTAYFVLSGAPTDAVGLGAVVDALNAHKIVEIAYPAPKYDVPCADEAPASNTCTISSNPLAWQQAAPAGHELQYGRTMPGGRGTGMRVYDVEGAWNWDHEDLPRITHVSGISVIGDFAHGTKTMGVLVGCEGNGFGISGGTPDATAHLASPESNRAFSFWNIPAAIEDAANHGVRGDVILIEQHSNFLAPTDGSICAPGCGCNGPGFVAVENWQGDFDAIRFATFARGMIVVEAAGNGGMNLDHPTYAGRFNRTLRDSGAILVGARGSGLDGNGDFGAWCFSNAGSRVDVNAWGDSVATTGNGDVSCGGSDDDQFYTTNYGGTSSASAVVASTVMSFQGTRRALGRTPRSAFTVRTHFANTGTSPAPTSRPIGTSVNLRAAHTLHVMDRVPGLADGRVRAVSLGRRTFQAVSRRGAALEARTYKNGAWLPPVTLAFDAAAADPSPIRTDAPATTRTYYRDSSQRISFIDRTDAGGSSGLQYATGVGLRFSERPHPVLFGSGYVDLFVLDEAGRLEQWFQPPPGGGSTPHSRMAGILPDNRPVMELRVAQVSRSRAYLFALDRVTRHQLWATVYYSSVTSRWEREGWFVLDPTYTYEHDATVANGRVILAQSAGSGDRVWTLPSAGAAFTRQPLTRTVSRSPTVVPLATPDSVVIAGGDGAGALSVVRMSGPTRVLSTSWTYGTGPTAPLLSAVPVSTTEVAVFSRQADGQVRVQFFDDLSAATP